MRLLTAPKGESMLAAPEPQGFRRSPERLAYIKRRWQEIQAADLPVIDDPENDWDDDVE